MLTTTVFVQGPYLVRNARIDGHRLALYGDLDGSTHITVFASSEIQKLSWNDKSMATKRSASGALTGFLKSSAKNITLPALSGWKVMNGLPEKRIDYDDSGAAWVIANKTTTPNPSKPYSSPVLYVDDYGFHTGTSLFRATVYGFPSSVTLGLQGGTAFGFSVFLNEIHIGSYLGNASLSATNQTFAIQPFVLQPHRAENVLLVVMDNSGHDLRAGALNPRGILLARITTGAFGTWKIAGTAGGETNIDPVRGPLAEGGLTSERLGWHLPGFDTSSWNTSAPSIGTKGAGIMFYRTVANLSLPKGHDTSIVFTLRVPSNSTSKFRAMLWVNGYQYGLFNPYIGNQVEFPVPNGILNLNGENTIAVSIWNQDDTLPAKLDIGWKAAYVHESGYDFHFDASALRPGWNESRLIYA